MHLQPSSSPHRNSIAAYCCCYRARRCGKTAVSRIVSRAGSLPLGLRSSHCNHSYGGDNAVCEVRAARKTLLLYHYSALAAADVSSLSLCKSQFPAQSSVTAVAVITVKGIVGVWRAWPGTAGAITEVRRLSSNSCNRVIRHRKPIRRRVRDGDALHGLSQSAHW
jgi:hypothetical protein